MKRDKRLNVAIHSFTRSPQRAPYVDPVDVLVRIAAAAAAAAAVDAAEPPKTTPPGAESLRPADIPAAPSRSARPTGVTDLLNASAVGVADLNSSFGVSCTPPKFRESASPGITNCCEVSLGSGRCSSSAVEAAAAAAAGWGDCDGGRSIGDSASDLNKSEDVAAAAAAGVESCLPWCVNMGVVAADIVAGLTPR